MNDDRENILFEKIKNDDEVAFKALFDTFYASLCHYANHFLEDHSLAEETVQQLFVKIWERRHTIKIESSVKNYLFRSVYNHCLNLLEHKKVRRQHARQLKENFREESDPDRFFLEPGLAEKIEACIEELPEKRREIFRLSREEGLKYREIADQLEISVKTVETQMGLALKTLREKLRNFTLLLFFFRIPAPRLGVKIKSTVIPAK